MQRNEPVLASIASSTGAGTAAQGAARGAVASAAPGRVILAGAETHIAWTAELLGEGLVVVTVAPPAAWVRGALAEHIDELVERELAARGAPSPYLTAWSAMPDDAGARFADQLFRARTVGASGLAIVLGSLVGIATPSLTPEDSDALAFLAAASTSTPLVLVLDDTDVGRAAWKPVSLGELVAPTAVVAASPPLPLVHATSTTIAITIAEETPVPSVGMADVLTDDDILSSSEVEVTVSHEEHAPEETTEPAEPEAVTTHVDAPVAAREAAQHRATVGVPVAGPSDAWRAWALALGAARGPQPLAAFERLFTESYMPLTHAIACGLEDPRALRAHDEFRRGFERTYADAFATFGATGRRPRLVMDAYEVAAKQARLHNARTTHLLIVDGMRWDLGMYVRDALAARAPGSLSLTAEQLLWSALPTTTFRQLETLARGMDALRAPSADEPANHGVESLRGRGADTVRRLRVGSRELYKLDLVPAMLGTLAPSVSDAAHVAEAMPEMADHVADALARHVGTLSPRTLLLVIGDHGFTVDRRGRVAHGGSSPEEVLVPALAYLVGDLH